MSLTGDVNLWYDPYFDEKYVGLYARDDVSLFSFDYSQGGECFRVRTLKRPIRKVAGKPMEELIYDLESAYGYGGFLTTTDNEIFLSDALNAYAQRCRDERIVAEFVRIHPFLPERNVERGFFDFYSQDRPTVAVDTTLSKEERRAHYSPKVRRKLRKCDRLLCFEECSDLDTFHRLYTETMHRNRANDFYFFDREFLKSLMNLPYSRLYAVRDEEEIVSMGFVLYGGGTAHLHLSANRTSKMNLNGNYLLFDAVFDEARKRGCRYAFLGGGRTNDPEDSLLRFKRQFEFFERPFRIAGKIYDAERYQKLVNMWEEANPASDIRYFLKYRLEGAVA